MIMVVPVQAVRVSMAVVGVTMLVTVGVDVQVAVEQSRGAGRALAVLVRAFDPRLSRAATAYGAHHSTSNSLIRISLPDVVWS